MMIFAVFLGILIFCVSFSAWGIFSQPEKDKNLDKKARKFLDTMRYEWRDMNISQEDGKVLYNLIIKHKYTQALEITKKR